MAVASGGAARKPANLPEGDPWRFVFEHGADSISVVGADGTVLLTTPAAERLSGYPPDSRIGHSLFDHVHQDDRERLAAAVEKTMRTPGLGEPIELRIRHADGSVRWIEAIGNNLLDEPTVGGVVVNAHDITDRKGAAEELSRSEQRWWMLLQNSTDIVSIVGKNGEITFSTPAAGLMGYPPGDVDMTMDEFLHPDDLARAAEVFVQILEKPGVSETFEFRVKHADGSWRWVESRANNLIDDPLVGGIVVNTHDITERKKVELALRESEARFRLLVQHSTDIIAILNADHSVRYASPAAARLHGFPQLPSETEARALLHPDDAEATIAEFGSRFETPSDRPIGYRLRDADGTWHYLESVATNLLDEPALQGVLVVTRDITEREGARHRRLVGEFFSDLFADASEDALRARAAAVDLGAAKLYQVLSLSVHPQDGPVDELFWHELGRRCDEMQGCVWAAFAGICSVVVPVHESTSVSDIAKQLERSALDCGGKRPIVAVGGLQPGLTGIKTSLEEANNMLAVARQRGIEGIVRQRDVVVPALLAASPRLADELISMFDALIEEDRRGRTPLLETLRTYVSCGLSVHKTAEALFVHRNTVRSRLRRIEELLGVSIADSKLSLELALLAHELRTEGGARD